MRGFKVLNPIRLQDTSDGESTRHIELDLNRTRLKYQAGGDIAHAFLQISINSLRRFADNLVVFPANNSERVTKLAQRLRAPLNAVCTIDKNGKISVLLKLAAVCSRCSVSELFVRFI